MGTTNWDAIDQLRRAGASLFQEIAQELGADREVVTELKSRGCKQRGRSGSGALRSRSTRRRIAGAGLDGRAHPRERVTAACRPPSVPDRDRAGVRRDARRRAGRGALASAALGSVSSAVTSHAACAVTIVRHR